MHILFLTQVLPYPLDAGPKMRAYYVLRYLAARHNVTLVTFIRPGDPPYAVAHLRKYCKQVITIPIHRSRLNDGLALVRSLATRHGDPFLITRDWIPSMVATLRRLLADSIPIDAVHADQLWMAPYALLANERSSPGSDRRLILDQHNAVFQVPQRLAQGEAQPIKKMFLQREARLLARYEARVCARFNRVIWVTAEDRQALENLPPYRQAALSASSIIPICVDPSELPFLPPSPAARSLLFIGGMHWPPNAAGVRWFGQHVWPLVASQNSGVTWQVIGRNPPAELHHLPRITAPGYMADISQPWRESAIFIVPLHAGGGMRVKILEAWARGLPIVSTTIGAEGLEYRSGENILLADTPADFAAAVARLLSDQSLAASLSQAGRRTVEEHYDWRQVYRAWDEVYTRTPLEKPTVL
ncbi:MAG: glycosyltransferase [Chloroflexi bacterium]|nr:glycosyltransferase [Chloroflexota bacterium]